MIRFFRPLDAEKLAKLYVQSVKSVTSRYYTAQQLSAWLHSAPTAQDLLNMVTSSCCLVMADAQDNEVKGFGTIRRGDGYIQYLYVHPKYAGQGVGSEILKSLENSCVSEMLTSRASERALSCFQRNGYVVQAKVYFQINSVWIHNYRVVKPRFVP